VGSWGTSALNRPKHSGGGVVLMLPWNAFVQTRPFHACSIVNCVEMNVNCDSCGMLMAEHVFSA
jgi:hypothetical protein